MHFKLWPEPSHPLFYGTSLSTLPYEICSETVIFGILKSNKGNLKHIFSGYLGLYKKETEWFRNMPESHKRVQSKLAC